MASRAADTDNTRPACMTGRQVRLTCSRLHPAVQGRGEALQKRGGCPRANGRANPKCGEAVMRHAAGCRHGSRQARSIHSLDSTTPAWLCWWRPCSTRSSVNQSTHDIQAFQPRPFTTHIRGTPGARNVLPPPSATQLTTKIAHSHTCTNSTNSQEAHVHANDDADHNNNTTATRANTT